MRDLLFGEAVERLDRNAAHAHMDFRSLVAFPQPVAHRHVAIIWSPHRDRDPSGGMPLKAF